MHSMLHLHCAVNLSFPIIRLKKSKKAQFFLLIFVTALRSTVNLNGIGQIEFLSKFQL